MLTRNQIKFISSLQKKKIREEERLFIIEGDKIVREFLGSGMKIVSLVAKPEFISSLGQELRSTVEDIIPVSYEELKKISGLKSPHNAMAIVRMPDTENNPMPSPDEFTIVLDCIQDPGNLGTIIRAAAWFGFRRIICSIDSVDVFNPKVIQATMGAILNVEVLYSDLRDFLGKARKASVPVFGTLLEGDSVYNSALGKSGIILLGNESKGISRELTRYIDYRISIPKFTLNDRGIESLNAGMAASIVFSEFKRRTVP